MSTPQSPESARPLIVATLTRLSDLDQLPSAVLQQVDWLEVRADLMGTDGFVDGSAAVPIDTAALRERFGGKLLYTLRSKAEGGQSTLAAVERRAAFEAAAGEFDFVDLELVADGDSGSVAAVPPGKRVLSWHGQFGSPVSLSELRDLLKQQRALGAAVYKLIAAADTPEEALPSLQLQVEEGAAGDLVSFAMGEAAAWSRVVSASRGGALVYAACGDAVAAAGQLSVQQLVRDYGLGAWDEASGTKDRSPDRSQRGRRRRVGAASVQSSTRLCGLLGSPVADSLSPRLHNGAYRDRNLDALFVAIDTKDVEPTLKMFTSQAFATLGFTLGGFAVTTPHKDAALTASEPTPRAETIGAVNTLIPKRRATDAAGWIGDSTDPEGVVGPLHRQRIPLVGKAVAVIGAGGAGRAAALGLREAGARVTLVNRSADRGEAAAVRVDASFTALVDFDPTEFAVVVNATALGHSPDDDLPFEVSALKRDAVVVDMVYLGGTPTPDPGASTVAAGDASSPRTTKLIQQAREHGLITVDGREVLLFQAVEQFEVMNDVDLDLERAAKRLGVELERRSSVDGAST